MHKIWHQILSRTSTRNPVTCWFGIYGSDVHVRTPSTYVFDMRLFDMRRGGPVGQETEVFVVDSSGN